MLQASVAQADCVAVCGAPLIDSEACALTLPRVAGALLFDAPSYAPLPGLNPEALEPAPPRLPDPQNDAPLRPRMQIPDMAVQLPRAALTTDAEALDDPEATARGPGQFDPPRTLATGGAARVADFSRGQGHGISLLQSSDGADEDLPDGAVLTLNPSFELIRRRPRVAHIADQPRPQRRAAPGAADTEAARQNTALARALRRPARLRLDAVMPRPHSAPDLSRMTARRSAGASGGVGGADVGLRASTKALSQNPPAPATGAFVSFARQTGRSGCGAPGSCIAHT